MNRIGSGPTYGAVTFVYDFSEEKKKKKRSETSDVKRYKVFFSRHTADRRL